MSALGVPPHYSATCSVKSGAPICGRHYAIQPIGQLEFHAGFFLSLGTLLVRLPVISVFEHDVPGTQLNQPPAPAQPAPSDMNSPNAMVQRTRLGGVTASGKCGALQVHPCFRGSGRNTSPLVHPGYSLTDTGHREIQSAGPLRAFVPP